MSEWMEYRLNDFAHINPSERIQKSSVAKKIPMESIQPFTKRIPSYSFEAFKGGVKFRNGDTLMARITPSLENGKTAYVDILDDDEIGFGSTEFIVLRERVGVSDPHFLYYLTISPTIRLTAIKSMTGSSGRQRVQTDVVKDHVFYAPQLAEQHAIASVLSSLDDKIDLLHRQNETLEKMAETLFRQWFVEEEKDNWEVVLFEDFVKHVKPGTNYQPKRVDFGVPFLNVRCFDNGFVNTSNSTYITQSEYERVHSKWVPEANDVLISRIGTLGLVAVITEKDLPIAVHYNMINLKAKMSSYQFLYFLLKSKWFQEEYLTKARQSVQAYLAIDDVKTIELKLPIGTDEFIAKQEIFNSLFDKIKSNQTQIHTLTALRDTLLPKLMSGEVRVSV